ncbi:MAG: hypothetical protein A2170_16120 [Deltaproteobacteria bacterium RBG_13_53_10]|nr:MAG: hypothetical protein A2170_16120 [Deltaproteobacteria bacterium RBG_13_53_10]
MKNNLARMLAGLSRVIGWLITAGGYAGSYLVVFAMLITAFDVVARYVFNSPTLFAYDLSRYVYFYVTLLLAPWVLRQEGHVRIDVVLLLIREKKHRAVLEFITSMLVILACAILFYQGVLSTVEDFVGHIRTDAALRIPRFLLFMGIPISAFLLICQGIIRAKANYDKITALKEEKKHG